MFLAALCVGLKIETMTTHCAITSLKLFHGLEKRYEAILVLDGILE